MRKWLIGIVGFTLLVIIGIFILLPAQIVVQQSVFVHASAKSSYRCLTEKSMIQKWWRADSKNKISNNFASFSENEWEYQFIPLMLNGVKVNINHGKKNIQSLITIAGLEKDSSYLEWKAEWPKTHNPIVRLQQYCHAHAMKKNIRDVLMQFSNFINNPERLYGLQINRTKVIDTLIATSKKVVSTYPVANEYYKMIEYLQQYVAAFDAQATNYPMLNISPIGKNEFGVMVGLPVNKPIPESNHIQLKRMIPGNILVAEITGGLNRIEAAKQEMINYLDDNNLRQPAIPYQQLITNRKAEPDSTRWVTKLYFPIY